MTDEVRGEIRRRAALAHSEQDMGQVIFDALKATDVNWRKVTAEEAKPMLVDSSSASTNCGP